ncbi:MAG: hypothetical protein KJO67_05245, partial [Silicimonas sp.]|nr:hypothetical protein [Silicimonas sp.]
MAADVSTSATKSFAPEKPVGSRFEVLLVWTKSDRLNDTSDRATGNWFVGAIGSRPTQTASENSFSLTRSP